MFNTLDISKNFLAIEEEYSSFDSSKIVVVPAPYEKTVSYGGGTVDGPDAILEASHFVEFYDEETQREVFRELGIATLQPLNFDGMSDVEALETLYRTTKSLIGKGKFVVTLGGEHTISQATIAAYAEAYPDLSVLQIDAHSDLRMEYQGNKFSHASVMARVCEFLDPRRVVQVGIRAQCKEEAEFIKEKGVTTLYAHEIREGKYTKVLKTWDEYVLEHLTDHVYVTFDVDGLDPSIMPSTGTPEPNGLFWWETMQLLRKIGKRKTVVACDVVELAPVEGVHHPDLTTAKLVSKMMNYFA
ncbi:MAG: agmatinase [Ignavibacteriae bacterium]|nr:agmatinase [Ignavibacteriota bacterium]